MNHIEVVPKKVMSKVVFHALILHYILLLWYVHWKQNQDSSKTACEIFKVIHNAAPMNTLLYSE